MKTWPLRIKIVIMAGAVVTAACLFLTALSIASANKYMRSIVSYDTAVLSPKATGPAPSNEEKRVPPAASIAENQIARENIITAFSINAILSMVATIIILAIAVYIVTGRILKPLGRLTQSICSIDEKNLRHRVELPRTKDEVYRLTQSFNTMMDRLEDSYTAQKNFAANAAHELKTPLSVMKTSLQVLELQACPCDEDYIEFADDVKQSLDRLIKTVENLMALTDSSLKGDAETVDALAVVCQVKQDLSPLSEEKGVSIAAAGDALMLTYNREMLYRLIYNLVENAVKYNRSGGYVDITLSDADQSILIKDNGIGMDSPAIQHIFEPFYRSDLSRSQKIPGSGLGMSIVKMIMDRYGGTLEIHSDSGRGTEIKFKVKN